MITVRETIQDLTYNGEPLQVVTGNPYSPEGSDRSKDIVLIPLTDGGAVTGAEAVYEANHRALEDSWGHLDAFTTHNGGYSLLIALFLDEEAPEDLEEVINSLDDYPVICEQTLSEIELEWMDEAWNDYGRNDVRRLLTSDLEEITSDADIDDAYYFWCRNSDYGAYLEGDFLVFDAAAVASLIVK